MNYGGGLVEGLREPSAALDVRVLDLLRQHKQTSDLTRPRDWVFVTGEAWKAAPPGVTHRFGRSLGRVRHDTGIVHISPHSFWHSYRAWLGELGTPIIVQQRVMRHPDIRVTMNRGGGKGLREASARVGARAIPQ